MSDRELVLSRLIDAAPEKVFRAWTDPALLTQWFAPSPWTTPSAELDVRPGGANLVVMRSPDGQDMPLRGVYLEVVPNRKLVFRRYSIPTTAPLMHVAIVPVRIERSPSDTISGRRSGTIAPIPPIRMPRLPKLAKPHIA